MTRLACIIPVLGTTDGLETTLVSVLERRPDDCELAVVLNASYDDPYQLSGEVKFLEAPRGAGLVQCLNLGIAATRAPIVHTLACGYEVADGWIERARMHFEDPRVAAVTPAIHSAADRAKLIAAGVGYRHGGSKYIVVGGESLPRPADETAVPSAKGFASYKASIGPLLQAAFIRREALTAFGGVLPTEVGNEVADIDLALTLRRAGWQIHFDSQCQVFAPSIEQQLNVGVVAAANTERLFWRHWAETGRLAGLIEHPVTVAKSIIGSGLKAPMAALGRFIGLCELGSARNYRQTLASATAAAEQAAAEWEWQNTELNRDAISSHGQSFRIDKPHPTGHRTEAEPARQGRRKAVRD